MVHEQPYMSGPPPRLLNISSKYRPPFQRTGPQGYGPEENQSKEKISTPFRSSHLHTQTTEAASLLRESDLIASQLPVMEMEPSSMTTSGPQPPASLQGVSQEDRRVGEVDALGYLDAVKSRFRDRLQIYDRFLDIMKDFETNVLVLNCLCFALCSVYH